MKHCDSQNLNKILRAAKDGDENALAALLSAYAPLIEAQTLLFVNSESELNERDDLRQEASIALCDAARHYDEAQSVSFGAFAKVCIHNRLISFQRKKLRQPPTLSLEEQNGLELEMPDPLQRLVEEDNFLALRRRIESVLSPYENRIWWLYVSGHTAQEIAQGLGKEEKSVQNAVYRIRKKLRATLPTP